jgi:hypothetical protein
MYYVALVTTFIINNFVYFVGFSEYIKLLIIKVVTKAYIIHKVIDYKGGDESYIINKVIDHKGGD